MIKATGWTIEEIGKLTIDQVELVLQGVTYAVTGKKPEEAKADKESDHNKTLSEAFSLPGIIGQKGKNKRAR